MSIIYSLEKRTRQKQEDEERIEEEMKLLILSEEDKTLRGMYYLVESVKTSFRIRYNEF